MVDLVIVGRVLTLAEPGSLGFVEAVAVADGRIVATGAGPDIEALAGPRTRHWRLPSGTCVMPGVTDAHLHLGMAAAATLGVRLGGLPDRDAVWAAIETAHANRVAAGDPDGWLTGDGWSLDQLGGWPSAVDLDALAPGRPVALWSHDHHTRWASSAALRIASIDRSSHDHGGLIRRDPTAQPTGVLHESATAILDRVMPEPTIEQRASAIRRYADELTALGVTGVHDPGDLAVGPDIDGPERYQLLARDGCLPIRVAASVRETQLETAIAAGMRTGQGIGRYRAGWLKLFADGSLGSRSAALLAPYEAGDPAGPPVGGPAGMLTHAAGPMCSVAARAASSGIAVQIHGIGDAAVRAALDVLERIPRVAGVAHRIEHAQLVDAADVSRFARSGIAASVQPCHLCSDVTAIRLAWGDRSDRAFPLAALDAAGALLPLGTDAPVESPDPWRNLAAAVRRTDPAWDAEEPAFHAEQAISLERALRAACVDPAITLGDPALGRLRAGSPADLIVIPDAGLRDPGLRGQHLAHTRPLATLIDGQVVHRHRDFDP